MSDYLPKVLIVSASHLDASSATATTLRNMFADWPRERLAQIHCDAIASSPSISSHRVSAIQTSNLRRRLLRRTSSTKEPGPVNVSVPGRDNLKDQRRWAYAALDMARWPEDRGMRRFIEEFRPDVVYSVLGSIHVTRIALRSQKLAGAPLVCHFMDDWLTTRYSSGEVFGLADKWLRLTVRRAVSSRGGSLAISPQMAREYSDAFATAFGVAGNCIQESSYGAPSCNQGAPEYVYIGGLHLGRADSLRVLADVVHRTDEATLRIFAPADDLARTGLDVHPGVTEARNADPAEMNEILRRADVAVHVESFDPQVRRFTRLSLSTKIPMYMAAARPILAICPDEIASGAYVVSTGSGVQAAAEPQSIVSAMAQLADHEFRRRMGERALEAARNAHTRSATTATLLRAIEGEQKSYRSYPPSS